MSLAPHSNETIFTNRFDQLDSLRGIAAALVVLHHCYQTDPVWAGVVRFTPARLLLNGRSSVIFFFVLSGFVLALGIWRRGRTISYSAFLSSRLARIYLPYAAAALVALAAMSVVTPGVLVGTGVNFNEMWAVPATKQVAFEHLALVGSPLAMGVNTPSWSLVYELRISLLLPLMAYLINRSVLVSTSAMVAMFVVADIWLIKSGGGLVPYAATSLSENLATTVHFTACFFVGALLAKAVVMEAAWLYHMSAKTKVAAVLGTALMFVFRDESCMIGAALIIILAINTEGLKRVLLGKPLLWLGRVSFSLYLTHMIVIEAIVRVLAGRVPLAVSLLIGMAVVPFVAILFFHLVEVPTCRLSKMLARKSFALPLFAQPAKA